MIVLVFNHKGALDAEMLSTTEEALVEVVSIVKDRWSIDLTPTTDIEDLQDEILEHDIEFEFEVVEFELPDAAIQSLTQALSDYPDDPRVSRQALEQVLAWLS